ncbi:MAG: hypothetical protein ACLP7Q_07810 [Isosphaeraceae bacterium]
MQERPTTKYLPGLERLENKQLLSTSHAATPLGKTTLASHSATFRAERAPSGPVAVGDPAGNQASAGEPTGAYPGSHTALALPLAQPKPTTGFLVYRITNPNRFNNKLVPPFAQVLVQTLQPVPGQVYNVLSVVVRNGTGQTFNASSGFAVKLPQDPTSFPILTGNQEWKPGQEIVFYTLTKKYYPLPSQVHSGFEFDLGGARSVAVPGPSAIFLRLTYEPSTFARTLDSIVAFGPGAQGGKGVKFGLPVTNIYEFLAAKTRRNDFGGYF